MSANLQDALTSSLSMLGPGVPGTRTGFALDTAPLVWSDILANRSGQALAWRFIAPSTSTVVRVAVYLSAVGGTPGALTLRLCAYGTGTAIPGNLVTNGTATAIPGSADSWLLFTFATPPGHTVGTPYWLVLGDGGWTTPNTSTILMRGNGPSINTLAVGYSSLIAYTSTTGFSTAGTVIGIPPVLAIEFGDGSFLGASYTNVVSYTSNTRERGLKIVGLTESLAVSGGAFPTATAYQGLKCYEGATIPGGTIFSGFNGGAILSLDNGCTALGATGFAPCVLSKDTVYRFVFTFGVVSPYPYCYVIEGYAAASAIVKAMLLGCSFLGGRLHSTISDGGTPEAWVDQVDRIPKLALIIRDQIPKGGPPVLGGTVVR